MPSFFRDVKIAFRQLRKAPGFAITAILMLALGIGATTAIFSIVEGVLLRPLPFPQPQRLVTLGDKLSGISGSDGFTSVTIPDIINYTRDTHSFSSLGGYAGNSYELSTGGDSSTVLAERMTGGVFPALDVKPLLGRVFTQQEDTQHAPVAVLSYSTWQQRFHGDRGILGSRILLDRNPYVVIGVMPRNFEFPLQPGHLNRVELWVPFSFRPDELTSTAAANWSYQMVGRLKPGVTSAEVLADTGRVAAETVRNYPAFLAGFNMTAEIAPLSEEVVRTARPLVHTLFWAVAVVLLIACANLAGLLLVRSIRRRREIAVRLALGAGAKTLLWQAILESLILSVSGGVLGLILAWGALHLGLRFLPESLPRLNEIGLDWHVVGFALLLAVLTGIVCGLAPAFAAMRTSVNDTLKEGGRTGSSGGSHARLRSALVVLEIAVALVLVAASGLLLRSFQKMRDTDPGYRPDHTLVASYSLPLKQYATQASIDTFNHELERRLSALPGVKSAGITTFLPATGNNSNSSFTAEGYVPAHASDIDLATMVSVEGDYFSAMGIPLLQGRFFTPDDKEGAQLVAIVNHRLAQQSWPGQNPLGKRLHLGTPNMNIPWAIVVGEVADVKEQSPDAPIKQQFYISLRQMEGLAGSLATPTDLNGNSGYIALRTSVDPEQMENTLRSTVHGIDPQLPLAQVQSMEHAISESEAPRRFNTVLISSFAGIAVLLAALGIYSVIAFTVALRVQEMAIRMALGSQRSGIVRLVLASGAKLALIGCVIGLAGVAAAGGLLRSLLYGVGAFDPPVLGFAFFSLLLLAILASLLPARKAASVNLTDTLRSE